MRHSHADFAVDTHNTMMRFLQTDRAFPGKASAFVILLCVTVLIVAAALRSTEYDENYSVFVTGGIARPVWPEAPFLANEVKEPFIAHTDALNTLKLLRDTDVHPPLYFVILGIWRDLTGDSLLAIRGLSVIFAAVAVMTWMLTAWRAGLPPLVVGILITFAYGFSYTGHIARGFALAHLLLAVTVFAVLEASRFKPTAPKSSIIWAATGGLTAGLATFTNYLAVFPAAVALSWLALTEPSWRRRFWMAAAAGLPFASVMICVLYFYLYQKNSRIGQFETFALWPMLIRLAQFNAASLFGGLPLYVEGSTRMVAGGALAALLLTVAAAIAYVWRQLEPTRWLWLSGTLAPSIGLIGLGAVFGNSPVELRYVAFAVPFAAALVAAATAAWARRAPVATVVAFSLVLAVQALSTLGMELHPSTQQPFRPAIAAASPYLGEGSVLLVPFGNDGVGITGSVLREVAPNQHLLVMNNTNACSVPFYAFPYRTAVMFGVGDQAGREQISATSAVLRNHPSWYSAGVIWQDFRGGYVEIFKQVQSASDTKLTMD
jgi:hypothetical protein